MDLASLAASLESSGLATGIKNSLYLFPFIESLHVIGITLVVGTIVIIDLRLLGLASTQRPYSRVTSDILKITWPAFALAVTTGLLMFVTNAGMYYQNFFFRTKMLLLVLAGFNVVVFELTAGRKMHHWNKDASAPAAGRAAAAISLLLWITIIFMGRWIGFTASESQPKLDPGTNLEELFPSPK
jgi:hypothetical protein